MAISMQPSSISSGNELQTTNVRAMSIATMLFFMWGFLTCLNDILIPHLKSIFQLTYAEALLVQFAFFTSYAVFAFPAGKVVEWIGYKRTMITGLLIMAVGALLFLPAASAASFPLFLGALIVLAAGITTLQVSANPYVANLGPQRTASSRLNLSQAFNSLGTFLAPFFGGALILGSLTTLTPDRIRALDASALQLYRAEQASSVRLPYLGIAIALVVLAVALALIKLPSMSFTQDIRPGELDQTRTHDSIWNHPQLLLGALGIFLYVGAEVSIGSFLINYFGLPEIGHLTEASAAKYVSLYWGGAMVGRFIGSAILTRIRTSRARRNGRRCCGYPRRHLHGQLRPHRHVEHHPRRPLQLRHVPQHLYSRYRGSRPAHQPRVQSDGGCDRRRRARPRARRRHRRPHRRPPRLLHPARLLSLYRVLRFQPQEQRLRDLTAATQLNLTASAHSSSAAASSLLSRAHW